ncbi:MAG: DNA replication/repair protein RecF [Bacilli bacterium]|nr:DNA replication/repair protein RecF [Bacilli bacterium]
MFGKIGFYMILKELELKNFRNYDDLKLSFSNNVNIFYGNNAEGKTNILESIYFLAITKSHRTNIDKSLLKNDKLFSKIKGIVESNNNVNKFEILINSKGKSVKINNQTIKKISNYISKFNVIMFYPNDMELIKGNPSIRRKYLNIEIGQVNNKYLSLLNEYNILIKNRNEYIKNKLFKEIDLNYISTIDEQISKKGAQIIIIRNQYINKININTKNIYNNIFGNGELIIKYKTNIEIDNYELENIEKIFYNKLKNNIKRDNFLGMTYYGPHRDDLTFYIDDIEVKEQSSQGQQRIIVICMKLGEIEIIKENTKEYPILLLDDIFSELDENKKNNILKYLKKENQTFITTTDINKISSNLLKNGNIYLIKNQNIIKKQ